MWLESRAIQTQSKYGTWTLLAFIRSKRLILSSLLISVLFSGSMLSFYGLSLSIGSVNGNIYLNFAILGMADALSNLALVFKDSDRNQTVKSSCEILKNIESDWKARYIKRVPLLMINFLGVGICCTIVGLLRLSGYQKNIAALIFFVLGKFFASCTSSLVFLVTAEAFPTDCRTLGVGICQFVARLMNVILIVILESTSENLWIPPIIFGLLTIVGGIISPFIENNSNKELRATISPVQ